MITEGFQENIIKTLIQPNYRNEIDSFIHGRKDWKKTGLVFETASKVFMGAGTVLSFSSGMFSSTNLSFVAGTVSTLSLICMQFSSFCYHKSKKSTEDLNLLLTQLKMDSIPDTIQIDPIEHKNIENIENGKKNNSLS